MCCVTAALWNSLLLLLVFATAAVADLQTRQLNVRRQHFEGQKGHSAAGLSNGQPTDVSGSTLGAASAPVEAEAVTREDILQTGLDAPVLRAGVVPAQWPQTGLEAPVLRAGVDPAQMPSSMSLAPVVPAALPSLALPAASATVAMPGTSGTALSTQQLLQMQQQQMQQMQQQLLKQQQELQRLQHQAQVQVQAQAEVEHPPQNSLVAVGAHTEMGSTDSSAVAMESSSGTKPKGWDMCLKFARHVKSQEVTGVELVRVWKSTCMPAVQSGKATERYRLMCNSLTGVVQPFSTTIDYDVEQLCSAVLAVFHDVTAADVVGAH
mmetsp:Transcript_16563/g.30547  ORF Transcript_16563/g.30547 Transcript_16563/m.30547 type:complete len:322 (+) Transcript_16563:52-1017(+)